MQKNNLELVINKPISEVFSFTITPPNSSLWIPSVKHEETNEWPIRKGTVYTLTNQSGESFSVTVRDMLENQYIEWISNDKKYHCRYTYEQISPNTTRLIYSEWVDEEEVDGPFTQDVLNNLKKVIESR